MKLREKRWVWFTVINKIKNLFYINKVTFAAETLTFKKENNSLIFTSGNRSNIYPSTSSINGFDLKPNTKYICRALVTEIDNGSSNLSASGTMRRSLKLQTLKSTYDSAGIYLINGYNGGYSGPNSEIVTKFKTPADMTKYKYVVTRMADKVTVIFKDIVIKEEV